MAWRLGRLHGLWVLGTLLLGALLTVFAVQQRERANAAFVQARFEAESRELADAIMDRLARYEHGLRGVRELVQHHSGRLPTAAEFSRYLDARDLQLEYPGARGFGYIARLQDGQGGERFIIEMVEPLTAPRWGWTLHASRTVTRPRARRSSVAAPP